MGTKNNPLFGGPSGVTGNCHAPFSGAWGWQQPRLPNFELKSGVTYFDFIT